MKHRMIVVAAAIVLAATPRLSSVSVAARQNALGPRPSGTASLGGRVMRDRTPVARAAVTIDAGDGRFGRQTMTDDDGRFAFERLPAGRFLITVTKMGWVTSYYGSPRPGRPPGVRVSVENGTRANVEVPMVPGSVIAGRIVDEHGRPMSRHWPLLLESRIVGDRRMLARVDLPLSVGWFERSTNDLGEFRLFGLPPGTYYLNVSPSIATGARVTTSDEVRWAMQSPSDTRAPALGPVAGYTAFYFPGSPDPAAAQPIVVGPGEVREGLEFRVGFIAVSRVSGVIRKPDGTPAAGARISLADRDAKVMLEGSSRGAASDAEGRFVFQSVPPGDYRLSARASSAPGSRPMPVAAAASVAERLAERGGQTPSAPVLDLWAQADVLVSGRDVEGVALALEPASTISGRFVFEGTTLKPPADLTTIRLHLATTDAAAAMLSGASGPMAQYATVERDGTFHLEGVPPDRYIASVTWPGMRTGDGTSGWWLTTIRVEGRDLGDAPIDVRPNTAVRDVALTFRDRIGSIEGVLTDAANRPAPEYFVLAFPVERASWTTTSRRMVPPARPSTDGRFRLPGLPAGEYYLAVVTVLDNDDATDPAFLESIVATAIRVGVADGETKRQDLQIK